MSINRFGILAEDDEDHSEKKIATSKTKITNPTNHSNIALESESQDGFQKISRRKKKKQPKEVVPLAYIVILRVTQ